MSQSSGTARSDVSTRRQSTTNSSTSLPSEGDFDKPTPASYQGNITLINEINVGDDAMVVRLSLDSQYWAVGTSKGAIKMFPVTPEKSNPVYALIPDGESLPCTDFQFVPFQPYYPNDKKHRLIATYASGYVRLWHYTGATAASRLVKVFCEEKQSVLSDKASVSLHEEPLHKSTPTSAVNDKTELNQIMCVSCSVDGHRFITAGDDCVIRVYDLANNCSLLNKCFSTHSSDKMDGHVMRICALKYLPLSNYTNVFISGSWDDTVQLWDDRNRASLWQYHGPHVSGSDGLDIDPVALHIITASWRRDKALLQVWKINMEVINDFAEGVESTSKVQYHKPLVEMPLPVNSMPTMGYVARFAADQFIIYAGSNSNMLKIIDRATLNAIGTVQDLPHGVFSVACYAPEEKRIWRTALCTGNRLLVLRVDRK